MKKYDDIIKMKHFHASGKPFMSNDDRAAQFMPFKSLNGFEDSISDSAENVLNDEWQDIDSSESQENPENLDEFGV